MLALCIAMCSCLVYAPKGCLGFFLVVVLYLSCGYSVSCWLIDYIYIVIIVIIVFFCMCACLSIGARAL